MLTLLILTLFVSLILFVGSLVAAALQGADMHKTYQHIISETLGTQATPAMQNSFGRAARRPARVLGTFIL